MDHKERGILYFCRDYLVRYEFEGDGQLLVIWEFPSFPSENEIPIFLSLIVPVHRRLIDSNPLYFQLEFPKEKVRIRDFVSAFPLWFECFKEELAKRVSLPSTVHALKDHLSRSLGKYVGSWLHYVHTRLTGKLATVTHIVTDFTCPVVPGITHVSVHTNLSENLILIELYPEFMTQPFVESFLFWFKPSGNPEEDTMKLTRIYNSVRDHIESYPLENFIILTEQVYENLIRECWDFIYGVVDGVRNQVDEIVRRSGRDFDETINALTKDFKVRFFTVDVKRDEKAGFDLLLHLSIPSTLSRHQWIKGFYTIPPYGEVTVNPYLVLKHRPQTFSFLFKRNDPSLLDELKPLFSGDPKMVARAFCVKVSLLPEVFELDEFSQETFKRFISFISERLP